MNLLKITSRFTFPFIFTLLIFQVAYGQSVEYLKDSKTGRVIFIKAAPVLAKSAIKVALASSSSVSNSYSSASSASLSSSSASSVASTKDPVLVADAFLSNYGKAFGLKNPTGDLIPLRVDSDKLKFNHVRYEQRFKGIPVFGSEMIVHVGADGVVKSANGQIAPWVNLSTAPKLSKAAAISRSKIFWGSEYSKSNLPTAQRVSLYVVAPGLLKNSSSTVAYLTYKVELGGSQPMSHMFYFVDAMTGLLRFKMDGVQRLNRKVQDCTTYPARSLCSSNWTDPTGYHHGRREGEASWGPNPAYNAYDVDTLYDHFGNLSNYLAVKFGRNGANGQGGLGNGSVIPWDVTDGQVYLDDYPPWTCPGAAFDPSSSIVAFCRSAMATDVIGHEYTHGLPFYSHFDGSNNPIGMVYSGESGALNESQSDVWGELFQLYLTGSTDWINWAENPQSAGRNLADPPSNDYILNGVNTPYPDNAYAEGVYCGGDDYTGLHINSTIVSKGAYLVANGGYFNGCSIDPIGTDKLEQILYRSVTTYYAQNETFNGAYQDQIEACGDLYGLGSATCRQVTKALQSLQLDQPGRCSGIPARVPLCQCEDNHDRNDLGNPKSVTYLGSEYHDFCATPRTLIIQGCENGSRKSTTINCGNGCVNSACLP